VEDVKNFVYVAKTLKKVNLFLGIASMNEFTDEFFFDHGSSLIRMVIYAHFLTLAS
jgi:hypothetical protein